MADRSDPLAAALLAGLNPRLARVLIRGAGPAALPTGGTSYPRPRPRNSPRVSVAVISRNQGEFLAQAVESVLAQTYPVREILVVDDASQDETPDVAADYAGRRVRYLWVDHRHPMLARRAATPRRRPPWRG